jgi:hypothetical protein
METEELVHLFIHICQKGLRIYHTKVVINCSPSLVNLIFLRFPKVCVPVITCLLETHEGGEGRACIAASLV